VEIKAGSPDRTVRVVRLEQTLPAVTIGVHSKHGMHEIMYDKEIKEATIGQVRPFCAETCRESVQAIGCRAARYCPMLMEGGGGRRLRCVIGEKTRWEPRSVSQNAVITCDVGGAEDSAGDMEQSADLCVCRLDCPGAQTHRAGCRVCPRTGHSSRQCVCSAMPAQMEEMGAASRPSRR